MADAETIESLSRLVDIMARLRAPSGCPWDREQTMESLRPYLVEEAYEVLDAIDRGDLGGVRDELGDVLLQVFFHSEIAAESGHFRLADVARAIADKLVRRHPHVFADVTVQDADEVVRNWRRIKAEERRAAGRETAPGLLAGVPGGLPSLARAQQVGDKLAHAGFDWPDLDAVLAKLDEERDELAAAVRGGDRAAAARELGDVLLTLTSVARHLDVQAEMTLRDAVSRLTRRVAHVETAARVSGRGLDDLDAAERDRLWDAAKASTDAPKTAGVSMTRKDVRGIDT
ncbi:MAG TPA: nucleoside triphosphate pyrophosphohydrolase [Candidatus Binatia bacterium]|nr:nucleoside triphosphate pyrophosphohydrolase [Candidatus Binatia bacterium]